MFEKSSNGPQGQGALTNILLTLEQLNAELSDVINALDSISYRVLGPTVSPGCPVIEGPSEKICVVSNIREKLDAYSSHLTRLRNVTQTLDGL